MAFNSLSMATVKNFAISISLSFEFIMVYVINFNYMIY